MNGTVVRLLPAKGYGFVRGEDGLTRFMHATSVEPQGAFDFLREGQPVEFDSVDGGGPEGRGAGKGNGLRAVNVRRADHLGEAAQ